MKRGTLHVLTITNKIEKNLSKINMKFDTSSAKTIGDLINTKQNKNNL